MAWNTKAHATQLTGITTEQFFSTLVALGLGEKAHIQVKGTFPESPSDYLLVQLYSTLDASSEQWDAKAFASFPIFSNEPVISFIVENYYKFRVGIKRVGATDSICADMWSRTGIQI